MRIINPQSATLTNIEVLTFLSANPPRRPPNPPPGVNQRHWIPSPDLRDHNTVVKEIHNYATRLSPHLLRYPQYTSPSSTEKPGKRSAAPEPETALDIALRNLITRLQPYGLTKGEVLMLINLGVGLPASGPAVEGGEGEEGGDTAEAGEGMDVDEGAAENGAGEGGVDGEEGGEEGEAGDYGALALVDTVIEEREQRLSDEDVTAILSIIRETLGSATT
ncbi:hypothetical protein BJX68DRAFT_56241 [Aspergillus pseudodeflectus]|uniref:DNA-directed RNA polymerase III subunit RPC9 n=1 Tax=Aspergillus pseudodeflectus TaxID=176178 RepID=A0ABR4KKU6_9EURO